MLSSTGKTESNAESDEKKEPIENPVSHDYQFTTDGTFLYVNGELMLHLGLYTKGINFLLKRSDPESMKLAASRITEKFFSFGCEKFRIDHRRTIEAEITDSREIIAASSEILEKLQAISNMQEPQSIELLKWLSKSYNLIEKNITDHCLKKREEDHSYAVSSDDDDDGYYQTQSLYQTNLSLLTIINGYAQEQENTQIVYRYRYRAYHFLEQPPLAPKALLSPVPPRKPAYFYLTRPAAFLPFVISDGVLPTGFPDSKVLRVSPTFSLERQHDSFQSRPFERFFFTYQPFGASLVGKTTNGSTMPLLNLDIDVPSGQEIVDVEFQLPSFHEDLQFLFLKVMASSIMKRTGSATAQIVCYLHCIDFAIHGFDLYFSNRMTFNALEKLIKIIIERQLEVVEKLTSFFKNELNFDITILTPFDNLMGYLDAEQDIITSVFKNLKLDQLTPNISRNNEEKIVELCLLALVTNTIFMDHATVWDDLVEIVVKNRGKITTLKQFLEMASVAALAISAYCMPSYTFCWMRLCSEMYGDDLIALFFKHTKYRFHPYMTLSVLDPCFSRENFHAEDKRQEGTSFNAQLPKSVYALMGPTFFPESMRNAAACAPPKSAEDVLREQQEELKRSRLTQHKKSVCG